MLDKLWNSTQALHARFGSHQTVDQALACFMEELAEVEAATTPAEITEECVDVIVTLMGVMMAQGWELPNFYRREDLWEYIDISSEDTFENCLNEIHGLAELLDNADYKGVRIDILRKAIRIVKLSGTQSDQFNAAVAKVIAKNDAKTHETHRLNEAGKIQRIGR